MPLRCHAEFNDDEKLKFAEFFASVPMPTERYNDMGLRYPLKTLNELGCSIIFFPIEVMADFVDGVSYHLVQTGAPAFEQQVMATDVPTMLRNRINCTTIGNLAYGALYHKKVNVRLKCVELLNGIYNRELNMLDNERLKKRF